MSDFVMFTPGADYVYNNGIPTTCTFGLSTKSVKDHARSGDDLAEIEAAAAQVTVQGGRYSEAAERMTNL